MEADSVSDHDDPADGPDGHRPADGTWTRRGLIAGVAAAGAGAAAAVVGGAAPAGATEGDPLVVGEANTATGETSLTTSSGIAFLTYTSTTGAAALQGVDNSDGGYGVYATSLAGNAVYGQMHATSGISGAANQVAGIVGDSDLGPGVVGASSETDGVAGYTSSTGYSGVSGSDTGAIGGYGVSGTSDYGYGLHGSGGLAPLLLDSGSTTGAPSTGMHRVGELYVDAFGSLFYCVVSGSPGVWSQIAAAGTTYAQGAFCLLSAPIRLLDTRLDATDAAITPGHPIIGGETYLLQVTETEQNGISVPAGAAAVIGNVTAVDAVARGYLTLWPHGVGQPPTSSLNFPASASQANGVTVALAPGPTSAGTMNIYASQTTDVIFDATGFIA